MEPTIDPATGRPLPADAIVRVLHITHPVHIYSVPPNPLPTYSAATWTAQPNNPIFTARLRILETSFPVPSPISPTPPSPTSPSSSQQQPTLKVDILLEDPSTAALFAAAPYTTPAIVTPTSDSSRFFALRVTDPSGTKRATLGIGFEERSDAFDFGVSLQEAGKALGFLPPSSALSSSSSSSSAGKGGKSGGGEEEEKRDLSLKEGETITVNLSGTRFARQRAESQSKETAQKGAAEGEGTGVSLNSFALPPPPGSSSSPSGFSSSSGSGSGGSGFLPPPPSAREVRAQKRLSAQKMGFDDGQFGEFA